MLVSSSKAMTAVVNLAEEAAKFPVNVLILGETGCGKELIARHIHNTSECTGKFVSINCTALPRELLESELFGYSKGAFTGAYASKKGIMEEAYGGSLLLDEIGDMHLNLQPKLLRVLDTKKFTPLGSTTPIKFNARIIATTNKNIDLLDGQTFRLDLYFRLATIIINIPPLRDRPDDIISLTNYFLGKIQEEFKLVNFPTISDSDIYELLLKYSWPGNIRELQNILKRSIILGGGNLKLDIIKNIIDTTPKFLNAGSGIDNIFVWQINKNGTNLKTATRALENHLIKYLIDTEPRTTSKIKLSKKLGICHATFLRKLRRKNMK